MRKKSRVYIKNKTLGKVFVFFLRIILTKNKIEKNVINCYNNLVISVTRVNITSLDNAINGKT